MSKVTVEFESGSRATFYPKHERVVFEFVTFEGVRVVDLSFDECLRVMQSVKARRGKAGA
jgi:hypothetical protein